MSGETGGALALPEWAQSDGRGPYPAVDPQGYKFLEALAPGVRVAVAGGFCPVEAEGLVGDLAFYYRERGGVASLKVAPTLRECLAPEHTLYSASEEVEEFRGTIHWVDSFLNLLEALERAPFPYEFLTWGAENDGESSEWAPRSEPPSEPTWEHRLTGWGFTPGEAFASLERYLPSPLLEARLEDHRQHWAALLATVSSTPLNRDEREWPTPEPAFTVLVPSEWRTPEGRVLTPWARRALEEEAALAAGELEELVLPQDFRGHRWEGSDPRLEWRVPSDSLPPLPKSD